MEALGRDDNNYGWKWTCETPFSSVFSALIFVLTQTVSFIPTRPKLLLFYFILFYTCRRIFNVFHAPHNRHYTVRI